MWVMPICFAVFFASSSCSLGYAGDVFVTAIAFFPRRP